MTVRRHRTALFVLSLLLLLAGYCILWLQARQRQHMLNRQLIAALVKNDTSAAIALVNAGADPNARYTPTPVPSLLRIGKQLLHGASSPANDTPTAFMMACGAPWKVGETSVFYAVQESLDNVKLTRMMLTRGATVNVQAEGNNTPLMCAVCFHRRKTVKVLLEHGANVNAQDSHGTTPLMIAARFHAAPDLVRLLLDSSANVNAQDEDGTTPLMLAVRTGTSPNLMLKYGANTNVQDKNGFTALRCAVYWVGDKDISRLLLAYGANPKLADDNGYTPLMLAQLANRPDLVALLKQAGARK